MAKRHSFHIERTTTYASYADHGVLEGLEVEIQLNGLVVDRGVVDAVTADGMILWLNQDGAHQRRLIEYTTDLCIRICSAD